MRYLLASVVLLLCAGCVHPVKDAMPVYRSPRAFQVLADTPERETTQIKELRDDVEVDTRDMDRTPHVVAVGETPLLRLEGAHAKLYGNKAGTQGWSVDNFVLFEIFDASGRRLNSAAVGSTDTVTLGREHVDDVGRRSFTFEPGEVDLTSHLPERDPFKIRATALDYGGVGRVSDLYVIFDYPAPGGEEDLRGQ
jgi:hypothetical protein